MTYEPDEQFWPDDSHAPPEEDLPKELIPKKQKPPLFPLDEVGNADILSFYYGEHLRFCYEWKSWIYWDGKRWNKDMGHYIVNCTKRALALYKGVYSSNTEVCKWIKSCQTLSRINASIKLAEPLLFTSPDIFDADGMLLNCNNGVIDLRTGELKPHDPLLYMMKMVPYDYDPEAPCSDWLDYLHLAQQDDDEMMDFLQRAVGYGITGNINEQVMFLLNGNGSNGKSTFTLTLAKLLGDYSIKLESKSLMSQKNQGMSTDIARLHGSRFVICNETDEEKKFDEPKVKELIGDTILTAERKFEMPFQFKASHKIFMSTNSLPGIKGTDEGIWRRLPVIEFKAHFWMKGRDEPGEPELEADIHFMDKLSMPGILRWAVDGAMEWNRIGLSIPDKVHQASKEYRGSMDEFDDFLSLNVDMNEKYRTRMGDLYKRYTRWANESNVAPLSKIELGRLLTKRGWDKIRDARAGWMWKGIYLKTLYEGGEQQSLLEPD